MSDKLAIIQPTCATLAHMSFRKKYKFYRQTLFWRNALMKWLAFCCTLYLSSAGAETNNEAALKGHHLAILLCTDCHIVAADQPYPPTLNPPAPSFASIAGRKNVDAASMEKFLATTYQGVDRPNGMPNPSLAKFQITEIVAYIMSLRKQ